MENKRFRHVFSVGEGCNMAAALSRTGLREHSGPFDWIMCGIEDSMKLIENHFSDFLQPDLLIPNPMPFNAGRKSHKNYPSVLFVHDFDPAEEAPSVEEQIGGVREKYQRRIDYFYQSIVEPTLFFYFDYDEGFPYWQENYQRILTFFKRYNPENELIVIAYGDPAEQPDTAIPYYYTRFEKDDHFVGYYVETNRQLSELMHNPQLISRSSRLRNLRFFIEKQLHANRDISVNETRIAKEKLTLEQNIWKNWVTALQNGRNFTGQLKSDGIRRVGLFGYGTFLEPAADALRAAGIQISWVFSWWALTGKTEVYGIPVFDAEAKFAQAEADMPEEPADDGESEELRWLRQMAEFPEFAEIDALFAIDPDDEPTARAADGLLPCKIYTLSDLLDPGAQPASARQRN